MSLASSRIRPRRCAWWTMLLVEQNDEWAVNKRYFSLESMVELLKAPSPTMTELPILEAA